MFKLGSIYSFVSSSFLPLSICIFILFFFNCVCYKLVSFFLFKEMSFDIHIVHSLYHLFSVSLLYAPIISILLLRLILLIFFFKNFLKVRILNMLDFGRFALKIHLLDSNSVYMLLTWISYIFTCRVSFII